METEKGLKSERGQVLMAAVVVMGVVALIFIAAIVARNINTQRSSNRMVKSISAYEVAQAAVDKAIWNINLDPNNWARIGSGGVLPGYDGATVFTDVPGGSYKAWITTGTADTDRVVTVWAKDASKSPQYRGIKVTLSKTSAQFGAVMAPVIRFQKRTKVHWGPIYAYQKLTLKNKSRVFYPRLFSKGKITHIDNNPALPNTDGLWWWSFNFPPGVPSWPQIDFDYYKSLAKSQGTYYAKGDRGRSVRHHDDKDDKDKDSDDKDDDKDRGDDDTYLYSSIIDTQPYVRYYDTGVKAKFRRGKNLLRGAIIAMDTVEFQDAPAPIAAVNAKYAASGLPNYYPRTVSIPPTAWKEYQKLDTSSPGDYPGDIGGPGASGVNATYTFGSSANDNLQTVQPIHMEGWIYAGNRVKLHRSGTLVGLVMANNANINMENSDEDNDKDGDGLHDDDHYSTYTDTDDKDDEDNDHHDQDPGDLRTHVAHHDWDDVAHGNRLSVYFQNLDIKTKGAAVTQKAWGEVAVTPF